MWDNATVLSFSPQEKNWFSKLNINKLKDIGFNLGQRDYLKNGYDCTYLVKRPIPFRHFPDNYPKSTQEYIAAINFDNTVNAISASQVTLNFSNLNPTIIQNTAQNAIQENQSPQLGGASSIDSSTDSLWATPPPSPSVPHQWDDSAVIAIEPKYKKWLSGQTTSRLKSYGFNINQCHYLKSDHGYSGIPVKPDFAKHIDLLSSIDTQEEPHLNDVFDEEEPTSSVDPTIETAHDLEVKYLDCLGVKNNEIIKAIGFRSNNNKNLIQYRKISSEGNSSSIIEEKFDDSFNFTLPKLGMINHDNYVIYVERTHKKSSPCRYRKGLRSESLKFYNLSFKELKSIGKTDIANPLHFNCEDSTRRLAKSMFFPKEFTFKEAIDEILEFKRLSAAFTSSLAIKLDSNSNKIVLQKHNWLIGEYNPKSNLFEMHIDTFNNDLIKLDIPFKEVA